MALLTIDLTRARVRKEEGMIVLKNKSVWLFTMSIKDGHSSISFGVTSVDHFEDWFQTIYKITETHYKLVLFYFYYLITRHYIFIIIIIICSIYSLLF